VRHRRDDLCRSLRDWSSTREMLGEIPNACERRSCVCALSAAISDRLIDSGLERPDLDGGTVKHDKQLEVINPAARSTATYPRTCVHLRTWHAIACNIDTVPHHVSWLLSPSVCVNKGSMVSPWEAGAGHVHHRSAIAIADRRT